MRIFKIYFLVIAITYVCRVVAFQNIHNKWKFKQGSIKFSDKSSIERESNTFFQDEPLNLNSFCDINDKVSHTFPSATDEAEYIKENNNNNINVIGKIERSQFDVNALNNKTEEVLIVFLDKILGSKIRRKLWTKLDYMHIHSSSGVIFIAGGLIWLVLSHLRLSNLISQNHDIDFTILDGILVAEYESPIIFCILFAGIINAMSAIPMAKFTNRKGYDVTDLKANGFIWGGTGLTSMCIWASLWFSNNNHDKTLDFWFVSLWSFICVISTWNWESMLRFNFEGSINDKSKPKNFSEKTLLYRLASWPNLSQIPFIMNIAIGGQEWFDRVLIDFPGQRAPLFHYSVASAIGYALSMLCETLRDRKIISFRVDLFILTFSILFPMISVLTDVLILNGHATINPSYYWVYF